jgi:hypothetical protein
MNESAGSYTDPSQGIYYHWTIPGEQPVYQPFVTTTWPYMTNYQPPARVKATIKEGDVEVTIEVFQMANESSDDMVKRLEDMIRAHKASLLKAANEKQVVLPFPINKLSTDVSATTASGNTGFTFLEKEEKPSGL